VPLGAVESRCCYNAACVQCALDAVRMSLRGVRCACIVGRLRVRGRGARTTAAFDGARATVRGADACTRRMADVQAACCMLQREHAVRHTLPTPGNARIAGHCALCTWHLDHRSKPELCDVPPVKQRAPSERGRQKCAAVADVRQQPAPAPARGRPSAECGREGVCAGRSSSLGRQAAPHGAARASSAHDTQGRQRVLQYSACIPEGHTVRKMFGGGTGTRGPGPSFNARRRAQGESGGEALGAAP
jgi:hypothetical protein